MIRRSLIAAFALASLQSWAYETKLFPPDPRAGESFVVQSEATARDAPARLIGTRVAREGSVITVFAEVSMYAAGTDRFSVVVPGLEAGTYRMMLKTDEPPGLERELGTLTVPAAQAPSTPRFTGVTGNWYDPKENGWGVNVIEGESGRQLFMVWLDYGIGGPAWYVISGGLWITDTSFRGLLYETAGSGPGQPFRKTLLAPLGYVTLDFTGPNELVFTPTAGFGAHRRHKQLRRQEF